MNEDNFTASICMPHPMKDFRFCCGVDMPAAFFLYTDGLEKAFLPSRGMKLACYLHKVMQFAIQEDGQGEKMIEKGHRYVADSSRTRDDTSLMVMADANAKVVVLQTMPLTFQEDYQRIQSAIKECRSTLTYNRKRLEENGNAADFMAKETIQRIQGIIERKNAELFTLMEQADNLLVEMEKWSVVLPQGGPEKTDSQPAVRVQQPESASVPKVDTATEEMHDEWVMEWEETPNMANVEIVKAANALGLCADHPQISPKVSDADDTDIDGSGTLETDDPATAAGRTLYICNLEGTVLLMQIDGASGAWKVCVKQGCKLLANAVPELRGNMLLPFVYENGTRKGQLFAEESTVNRKKFARVVVAPETTLRIGSGKDNDLICNASFAEEHIWCLRMTAP